ncbi:uncharacterized protein EAF01_006790 [Botrytis porri]|uniref:uncharacterized protein n=1 Tax=Botrytis porri TaxID=87229 RepID=UPI001900EF7F|nr:uncharacterized protein EAF01_006790 [Botrytis porri]KAF7903741.1 hypothetical protein EAF01_006790 [Botrytis porri]
MENKNSTPCSNFILGDCGAAIGRQYSRIMGSKRNYRDDLEANIPGQTDIGASCRDLNNRTSRPKSRGPGSRLPHPPIPSQAQIYHRSYPDRQTGLENGTAPYSTQITRSQPDTQPPMRYPIPSTSPQGARAGSRGIATPGRSSRLSSSSNQIASKSSTRFREPTTRNHIRGKQNIRAESGSTILRPNSYAYVSANDSARCGTAGSVASHRLDSSRSGKEDV